MDTTWQFVCIASLMITGVIAAFVHDIYRALVKALKVKGVVFAVAEVIFAFAVFTAVSTVLVWLTSGALRPVYLLSIGLGIVIYYVICGKRIQNTAKMIITKFKRLFVIFFRIIIQICYMIGKVITWPIAAVFRISTCIANGFNCIMKSRR